jgi:hypothetical protein
MLSPSRRSWIAAVLVGVMGPAGCAFDGAQGSSAPPEEDPLPTTPRPDAGNGGDAPGGGNTTLECEDFIEIEGSRYIIIPQALSWPDADARCKQIEGAHLATFESAEEVTAVVTGIPVGVDVWTGVTQAPGFFGFGGQTSGWANLQRNGDRVALPSGFPWRSGEPNDGNGAYFEDNAQNHADLGADAKFDDSNRSDTKQVLCECKEDE